MRYIFFLVLLAHLNLYADVKGLNQIKFDIDSDGSSEMQLNSIGLGIGGSPSTNLSILGNAIINKSITIGSDISTNSNLHINGSVGFNLETISSNISLDAQSSYYIITSDKNGLISIVLPESTAHEGKMIDLKSIFSNGNVLISAKSQIDKSGDLKLETYSSVKLMAASGNWYLLSQTGSTTLYQGYSDNLVAYYNFIEDDSDYSLENNQATISGTTFPIATSYGPIGNGLLFDGIDDMLTVTDSNSLDLSNQATISFWIKPSSNNTSHGAFSGWTERTALINPNDEDDQSQVNFIQAGNAFYYAAYTHVGSNEAFELGQSDDNFESLTWMNATSAPDGAGGNEATSVSIETDGNLLYFAAFTHDQDDESFYIASSNLDFSGFSDWLPRNSPDGSGAQEAGYIDSVIVDDKIYYAAYLHTGNKETFSVGSSNLDYSGNIIWTTATNTFDLDSGGRDASSVGIDSDGEKLYYALYGNQGADEDMYTAVSDLDGTNFIWSSEHTSPNENSADRGTHIDSVIAGARMHYALILASEDDNEVYVYTALGNLNTANISSWTSRGAVRASIPGLSTFFDSLSIDIESNGANLQLLAYSGNSTSSNILSATIELPSTPVLYKEDAYSLYYTGGGFVFNWAGRPISFGNLSTTEYSHVAITHDGINLIFYVNGNEVRRQPTSVDFEMTTTDLIIGSDGTRFFKGQLDEIRIYNAALSSSVIQTLSTLNN